MFSSHTPLRHILKVHLFKCGEWAVSLRTNDTKRKLILLLWVVSFNCNGNLHTFFSWIINVECYTPYKVKKYPGYSKRLCSVVRSFYFLAFSPDMSNQSMPHKPPSPPVTQQALNFPALEKCRQLLEHIAPYCKYHGINIKSCYEDFDQHNIGLVTESQVFTSLLFVYFVMCFWFVHTQASRI